MKNKVKYKGLILQEKMSKSGVPMRIFRKELLEGYKEIDLPFDKYIVVNERTGIPFLKTKPQNNDEEKYIFCYWE